MPYQQIGTAVVFGIPDITSIKSSNTETNADAASALGLIVTGISISKTRSMEETADADGDIVNVCLYGQSEEASIECFPQSTTTSGAKSANALPTVGNVIAITPNGDTEEADLAVSANKYWTITGVSKNRSNTSKATWTLTCKRWGGISDQSQV